VSYSVQLGAFKNEVYAQALVKELRDKGYEAIAKSGVTKDNSTVYRVFVGKFEGKKAAENLAREIQSKEGVKTTLYSE
jgi:cell division septation protein DedD